MSAMLTRMHSLNVLALILALLTIVGVLYFFSGDLGKDEKSYWPPLTMLYEVDGPVHNGQTVREVRRLEYRSATDWTDTVIESDPFESLALGTVSTAGSYMQLKGNLIEEYDSTTEDISVDERTEGGLFVPNAYTVPFRFFVEDPARAPDGTPYTAVATTSKICYRSLCEENAVGLAFKRGAGTEWVVLDDERWGIVLKAGGAFVVRELILDASKVGSKSSHLTH